MKTSMAREKASRRRVLFERVTSVSRTFSISLLWLPEAVREEVALAYLLARISDTISDAPADWTAERRIDVLRIMQQAFDDPARIDRVVVAVEECCQLWLPPKGNGLSSPTERKALAEAGRWLRHMHALEEMDRRLVGSTLHTILSGQIWDLQRFGAPSFSRRPIESATWAELEEYQYAVAGCVGKFWTEICGRKLPVYTQKSMDALSKLGVEFGKGLQLVNILRDRREDLDRGRCYIPLAERTVCLPDDGVHQRLFDASVPLLKIARRQLMAGLSYAARLIGFRVRFVVLVPALLGLRTLDLLCAAGHTALEERLKVGRDDVRSILFRAAFLAINPSALLRELLRERLTARKADKGWRES
ncbi:MAG: squalene/phytoene synthase family protein [Verrucomicrobiia bacterium]